MVYCWGLRVLATKASAQHRFEPLSKTDPEDGSPVVKEQQSRGTRMGNSKPLVLGPTSTMNTAESPLVPLSMPSAAPQDADDDIEDRLFAAALGGLANTTEDPWSAAPWSVPPKPQGAAPVAGANQDLHFDADFEEIMRRINDDGTHGGGGDHLGAQNPSDSFDLGLLDLGGPVEEPPPIAGDESVVAFDVDTLLDINMGQQHDDEDELLKGIEDT